MPCLMTGRRTLRSHTGTGVAYETTDASMTKIMLNGLTDKTVEELAPLTKSWANPPELKVVGGGFENEGLRRGQTSPSI